MIRTDYITAIEISSSKISGTVGVNTYEGIKILAAASIPVEGFVSKGVVRNVDETSNAINRIINSLEENLDNVAIKFMSFHATKPGSAENIPLIQENCSISTSS